MGFYHHLFVKKSNGERSDIGGHSKGGSKKVWYSAFSPTEYINNLESFVGEYFPIGGINVGYKTKVKSAKIRLNATLNKLNMIQDHRMLNYEDNLLITNLVNGIESMVQSISNFEDNDVLILDQSEGASYSFESEGNKIIGLSYFWYDNGAANLLYEIEGFKKDWEAPINIITSYLPYIISEEKKHFIGDLQAIKAEDERGYGPNLLSEFVLDYEPKKSTSNNPKEFFVQASHELMKKLDLTPNTKVATTEHEASEFGGYLYSLYITIKEITDDKPRMQNKKNNDGQPFTYEQLDKLSKVIAVPYVFETGHPNIHENTYDNAQSDPFEDAKEDTGIDPFGSNGSLKFIRDEDDLPF
jgi:hypothetical protein